MSTAFKVQAKGLSRAQRQLLQLTQIDFRAELLESVGDLVESQTRQRIEEFKEAPGGGAWPEWSPRYARTRHEGQSLLQSKGAWDNNLTNSIQYLVQGEDVVVGSNLIYAATHQYGDEKRGIPAREFLGLSAEDEVELGDLVQDFAADLL